MEVGGGEPAMGKSGIQATVNTDLLPHQKSWVEPRGSYFLDTLMCSHLGTPGIKPGMLNSG